jgi:DNA-binding response OmpR family regulator
VRILTVGTDVDLLTTRQAVLTSRGYESLIATPEDVDEKLQSGKFDLVILSVMLSQEEKRVIRLNCRRARVRSS